MTWNCTESFNWGSRYTSSGSASLIQELCGNSRNRISKQLLLAGTEAVILALQTFKRDYRRDGNYCKYCLDNRSTHHDDTMLSHIPNMVKKIKSQKKAPILNQSDSFSIIKFLVIFKLACDNNRNHKKAALCVLPFFVKNAHSTILNSSMPAAAHNAPLVSSVKTTKPLIQNKLR